MVSLEELRKVLSDVFGNDEQYLVIAAANNAGIRADTRSPRKMLISDEIDKFCDGFFGNKSNASWFLQSDRYEDKSDMSRAKPVFSCSDAHSFDDIHNKLGKELVVNGNVVCQSTWIKADPTFDGLRQTLYEPDSRVSITETRPNEPINKIECLLFNLPKDSKVGSDRFCFAGHSGQYELSPFFNCIIGGRGTGKSTILNFLGIHSNDPKEPKQFWTELQPSFEFGDKSIFDFEGAENFEYLAQSEIESYAKDKTRFTNAIYDRANSYAGQVLDDYEADQIELQNSLDKVIDSFFRLEAINKEIGLVAREKRTLEKSLKVIESPKFKKIRKRIEEGSQVVEDLDDWKAEVAGLREDILSLVPEELSAEDDDEEFENEYERAYFTTIAKLMALAAGLEPVNFAAEQTREQSLRKELEKLEKQSRKILEKANLSVENLEQLNTAPKKITFIKRSIQQKEEEIGKHQKIIEALDRNVDSLKDLSQGFQGKIQEILEPLQELLKVEYESQAKGEIKPITLEFYFDNDTAWKELSEEFYERFKDDFHVSEKSSHVCDFILSHRGLFLAKDPTKIRSKLRTEGKKKNKYIEFLSSILASDLNHQIFRAIRDKHLYDVIRYKRIQVKYDNKNIELASFGQRCTAVVVILLLFGNLPLIIDEPEAHLDSSLIANYLVPLIKKKKSDRQIVFATHNANFVINGDAEKIIVLENETGISEVIETTIEDKRHRERLLKLEGGAEAFAKRGEKLVNNA